MELVIILVLGVPIALAIWLVARALQSGNRIEELSARLSKLELRVSRLKEPPVPAPVPEAQPEEIAIAVPPTPPPAPAVAEPPMPPAAKAPELEAPPPIVPPPAPVFEPVIPLSAPMLAAKLEEPTSVESFTAKGAPVLPPISATPLLPKRQAAPLPVLAARAEAEHAPAAATHPTASRPVTEKGSFEMRLGTYWLVRVGIVMLLTGLVFFGNYAYQNFIVQLGPGGKVGLLYFASALLLGAGAWWQRGAVKESLRNYAQVLFAGGLAAVYFTTYAAHHFPRLRVIESAALDGGLLLAWAGFMAWVADRRKSEVLALFAVGLAYYTSVITQVGAFTLYSNLVLTLAAVFFLLRNRWAGLSCASLAATYASYAFWRFYHVGEWRWAAPDEGLWFGAYFLMSYWVVFTAAVFWSKHEKLAGDSRAGFLTFNNGAFFTLFLLTMLQARQGGFWKFSLSYGVVLLALTEAARRILPAEPLTKNSYLTQGLLLVTLAFIARFAGLQLALVLGVESVVLFVLGTQQRSLILQIAAGVAAALAVGWGFDGLKPNDERGLWLGSALGALMVFNSFWAHRQDAGVNPNPLRAEPAYFSVLAVVLALATTWFNTSRTNYPIAVAAEAILLTASVYPLRVRELALLGQTLLLAGHCVWQFNLFHSGAPPWWNPAIMIGLTLGLGHWWHKQKVIVLDTRALLVFQLALSLLLVLLACTWLGRECSNETWLPLSCLLAVAVTVYAAATRAWLLAACAQLFLLPGAWLFLQQVSRAGEPRFGALAPIGALGLLSFAAVSWFKQKPDADAGVSEPLLKLALAYRCVALAMSLWWVLEYIPRREQIWTLMLIGLAVFAFAGWRRSWEALLFGAAFSGLGVLLLWVRAYEPGYVYLVNGLAILALLAQQQAAQRFPSRFALSPRAHAAVIVIGGLTLWLFVSRWVVRGASGFYLAASWSALALVLFGCGMALRQRMYRWLGLAVLAGALGRVVVFDVWKLETVYRILSFMALGIVLLVLGFIYNKYQEKIRQWL